MNGSGGEADQLSQCVSICLDPSDSSAAHYRYTS